MDQKRKHYLISIFIPVISIIIVAGAMLFFAVSGEAAKPILYVNHDNGVSFTFSGNLTAVDQKLDSNTSVVDLFMKGQENKTKEVISLTQTMSDPAKPILDIADEYLQINDDDSAILVDNEKIDEARYVNYSPTGEVIYYNFFKDGSRFYILRFNQKIFDMNNPLVIRNNSYFNSAYLKILSTIKFNEA